MFTVLPRAVSMINDQLQKKHTVLSTHPSKYRKRDREREREREANTNWAKQNINTSMHNNMLTHSNICTNTHTNTEREGETQRVRWEGERGGGGGSQDVSTWLFIWLVDTLTSWVLSSNAGHLSDPGNTITSVNRVWLWGRGRGGGGGGPTYIY